MSNNKGNLKAYDGDKLTYTSPHDSWFKKKVITTIEVLSGRKHIHKVYDELYAEDPDPWKVWGNALEKLKIGMDYDAQQLKKFPKTGPVIFVANHPFGVVDGAVFGHLVTRVRKDYFLLVNEVLAKDPIMKDHLLPVDFRDNEEALQTNLETKRLTTERLNNGEALLIFPSGAVATRLGPFKKTTEFPWRKFICTRIHETQCTVVPLYFHGNNSWLFSIVSWFSMNLRLGLLLHEIMNKRNTTIKVTIGDPITYDTLKNYPDRQDLIDFLRAETMALGE